MVDGEQSKPGPSAPARVPVRSKRAGASIFVPKQREQHAEQAREKAAAAAALAEELMTKHEQEMRLIWRKVRPRRISASIAHGFSLPSARHLLPICPPPSCTTIPSVTLLLPITLLPALSSPVESALSSPLESRSPLQSFDLPCLVSQNGRPEPDMEARAAELAHVSEFKLPLQLERIIPPDAMPWYKRLRELADNPDLPDFYYLCPVRDYRKDDSYRCLLGAVAYRSLPSLNAEEGLFSRLLHAFLCFCWMVKPGVAFQSWAQRYHALMDTTQTRNDAAGLAQLLMALRLAAGARTLSPLTS